MAYPKDLTGMIFGKLTVLERDLSKPKGGATYWICQCSCENHTIKTFRRDALTKTKNPVRDCGCGNLERRRANIDITSLVGKTFGRLTVLERDLSKPIGHGEGSYWICQCSCDNKTIVSISHAQLTTKKTQSCGCLRKELLTQRNIKDITGQRFGMIVAREQLNQKNNHNCYLWRCECDCGNKNYVVSTEDLLSGKIHSCGCNKRSYGEQLITKILTDNNIQFISQYVFPELKGVNNGYLKFDFAITAPDFQLIEYDGEQHFKAIEHWGGEKAFKERQTNDQLKNDYCKVHNIPLKRIPYTELNHITIENIISDKYLI